MPTVLITGGAGFIGSNFVRHLLATDPAVQIVNFDALTYAGNLANLRDLDGHPRHTFVRGDVTSRDDVRGAMQRGVTDVIHFAAESHVDRSIHDSGPFVRTNVLGTQVLLDAAREFQVSKYVQVSTDEVYGSLGATGLFTEETPLHPNSPYSASKAGADLLVQAYQHTFGLPAVITRCSNNYGPYQLPEKLIPLFVTNLLADQQVPVYGDGQQVRDWIHVLDHCRGVEAAWRRGAPGEVYNFGGRCEMANLDLTLLLLKLLGKPETLIKYVADRLGHDRRYAIDCTKAERELGWAPQVKFDAGLAETIGWYKANTAWVATIKNKDYLSYYEKQYGKRG
ncbi:dTDP-glucose 4,6-dehydratase [Gemmata obscuriglobus]|uniref:dTDP-glucose 4,6-dehydratase n=1 Tax=Gemmata obscuriglobus TaxID=114 RepID=A0A2Z3H9Y2_9BACT|nr:dTDP-glucose 4,6-dehydratase [Gemmata obscuriglobus]AWM42528.1 dTDP-glucose 4,6-dehydratase [Gemmata obscuriglobus]QEG32241.1 dTDP-glucose 4,6-dehydratase [Gemmata obscuriglobus]VTS11597.1 spore coat protein : dTDP-glucose 4,6-dehydratase OS=Planctomyces maris DSM 8797 GN=PM8797T_31915 PE=3 SV=1: Epimerase [Gemmata obscuriglobus UQM 2246]